MLGVLLKSTSDFEAEEWEPSAHAQHPKGEQRHEMVDVKTSLPTSTLKPVQLSQPTHLPKKGI